MQAAANQAASSAARTGPLLVLLGPSGSGKDTLITYASAALSASSGVLFVQRAITRPADAGSENHIAMTDPEFDAAIDEGLFALTWAANGLRYGLPRSVEAHLASGKPAVVNGSRGAWGVIRRVFPSAVAVEVRVDRSVLAARLKSRGRESAAEIEARLERAASLSEQVDADHVINNSSTVEVAGDAFVACIQRLAASTETERGS